MLENVFWACGFVLTCILLYRFGLPALKRFDAQNVSRIEQQERDKADPTAHIRHALETAEEQVEQISEVKTAAGVQYLFEAQLFLTRDEAEEARANRRLLHWLMTEEGFAGHPDEWWHFSWGDQMWAALTGAPHAHYGAAAEAAQINKAIISD